MPIAEVLEVAMDTRVVPELSMTSIRPSAADSDVAGVKLTVTVRVVPIWLLMSK